MADQSVILLVEDLDDDITLVRRSFQRAKLPNPLHIVRDGEEAVAYLTGQGKYARRAEFPLPDLILLDLKMPKMDGFEVLEWLREQPGLRSLVVVVLTSSEQLRDVNKAYALGANSFLVKPADFQNHVELSKLLRDYWLRLVKTPEAFRPIPKPGGRQAET